MIEEITKTAVDIAKAHGATFLLDKSGPTLVGVSNILYFEPDLDITDEVIAAINKDRPAVTPTPTSAAPAAVARTPRRSRCRPCRRATRGSQRPRFQAEPRLR